MRPFLACLLLTAIVLPVAAADQSGASTMAAQGEAKADAKVVDHAMARRAASAAVANSKSEPTWADKMKGGPMAKTGAKAETKADKEGKAKMKAAPPPAQPETRAAAPDTGTGRDQSVCDLTPHPSWCDQ